MDLKRNLDIILTSEELKWITHKVFPNNPNKQSFDL